MTTTSSRQFKGVWKAAFVQASSDSYLTTKAHASTSAMKALLISSAGPAERVCVQSPEKWVKSRLHS